MSNDKDTELHTRRRLARRMEVITSKSCRTLEVLALAAWLAFWPRGLAQSPSGSKQETPYEIQLPVDEVSIFFRATDADGLTVSDLKLQELDLFDNEEGPGQILSLRPLADRPVSAGFLIDVSGSFANYVWEGRSLAAQVAQKLIARRHGRNFSAVTGG